MKLPQLLKNAVNWFMKQINKVVDVYDRLTTPAQNTARTTDTPHRSTLSVGEMNRVMQRSTAQSAMLAAATNKGKEQDARPAVTLHLPGFSGHNKGK